MMLVWAVSGQEIEFFMSSGCCSVQQQCALVFSLLTGMLFLSNVFFVCPWQTALRVCLRALHGTVMNMDAYHEGNWWQNEKTGCLCSVYWLIGLSWMKVPNICCLHHLQFDSLCIWLFIKYLYQEEKKVIWRIDLFEFFISIFIFY